MQADSEMNANDIEDELRDVVFDYESSKAVVLAADNFLTEKPAYIGPELDDISENPSNISSMTDKSIINRNKLMQGKHDPSKIKLLQDRLDPKSKARLEKLLQEIDDNMEELMKEKEEYHKMGMRSTKGGFAGAGQFDTKSHMSGVTSATRAINSNNAYLYAAGDQQKIQDINERLQAYNPSLAGSAMMSNDNYDKEAQILPSHKREKFNKNRGDDVQDRSDT